MHPFVSPGVYTREIDLSLYAPLLSTSIFGLVGTASSGPVNKRTFISTPEQFLRIFGNPSTAHYATFAAIQFLRRGRQLWYVRVESSTSPAVKASVVLTDDSLVDTNRVDAKYPGTRFNGLQVTATTATKGSGFYKLVVKDVKGRTLEIWDNLTDDTAPAIISDNSEFITIVDIADSSNNPTLGTYTLVSGDDGTTSIADSDFVGVISGQNATGLQLLKNPEEVDVNMIAIPGRSSGSIQNNLLLVAVDRSDCLAILDPPFGLSVQGVVDYHNGTGSYSGQHQAFDSSYGALYWPWIRVLDPFSGLEVWLPPSGFVAGTYAYNDLVAEPWFAPAGFNRGRILEALTLEMSPSLGDRDLLYSGGNAVNPIVNFTPEGVTIWGQRTLQRTPTSLDRVNVRRLLLSIRKLAATTARSIVFEPNDKFTWNRFTAAMIDIVEPVKSRRGVYDYRVICDETTNPPSQIDQGVMRGRIMIKPTKAAEIIVIDFEILNTGTKFEEIATSVV